MSRVVLPSKETVHLKQTGLESGIAHHLAGFVDGLALGPVSAQGRYLQQRAAGQAEDRADAAAEAIEIMRKGAGDLAAVVDAGGVALVGAAAEQVGDGAAAEHRGMNGLAAIGCEDQANRGAAGIDGRGRRWQPAARAAQVLDAAAGVAHGAKSTLAAVVAVAGGVAIAGDAQALAVLRLAGQGLQVDRVVARDGQRLRGRGQDHAGRSEGGGLKLHGCFP